MRKCSTVILVVFCLWTTTTTANIILCYFKLLYFIFCDYKTYFNVANEARRFVEYSNIKPCTNSSRNAFAPWYDEKITSIFRFVSPKNVSNITLRSLDIAHVGSDNIGLMMLSTENGSPQNMHTMIRMSGDASHWYKSTSSGFWWSVSRMHSIMLFKIL